MGGFGLYATIYNLYCYITLRYSTVYYIYSVLYILYCAAILIPPWRPVPPPHHLLKMIPVDDVYGHFRGLGFRACFLGERRGVKHSVHNDSIFS